LIVALMRMSKAIKHNYTMQLLRTTEGQSRGEEATLYVRESDSSFRTRMPLEAIQVLARNRHLE